MVVTAAITGTIIASTNEQEVVDGGRTIIITLTGANWIGLLGDDNADTQALIDAFVAAFTPITGWNNIVQDELTHAAVTRTSDTVMTIVMPGFADYDIIVNELITLTIPDTLFNEFDEVGGPGDITLTLQIPPMGPVTVVAVAGAIDNEEFKAPDLQIPGMGPVSVVAVEQSPTQTAFPAAFLQIPAMGGVSVTARLTGIVWPISTVQASVVKPGGVSGGHAIILFVPVVTVSLVIAPKMGTDLFVTPGPVVAVTAIVAFVGVAFSNQFVKPTPVVATTVAVAPLSINERQTVSPSPVAAASAVVAPVYAFTNQYVGPGPITAATVIVGPIVHSP